MARQILWKSWKKWKKFVERNRVHGDCCSPDNQIKKKSNAKWAGVTCKWPADGWLVSGLRIKKIGRNNFVSFQKKELQVSVRSMTWTCPVSIDRSRLRANQRCSPVAGVYWGAFASAVQLGPPFSRTSTVHLCACAAHWSHLCVGIRFDRENCGS